jgi:uncharacterized Ntn-hydrolase superfamily protein
MTFSLLARDPESGALGGAAATGNLCVGAWVLRGKAGVGLSASQGHYPSTLWSDNVLDHLANGIEPEDAIRETVAPDPGRAVRQLLALDQNGRGAAFSGDMNVPEIAEQVKPGICAGGNMLSHAGVIDAMVEGYQSAQASFLQRLLAGLKQGAQAGGDARGLMSAAVLIVSKSSPPVDIRIDQAQDPLGELANLAASVEAPEYKRWMQALPTLSVPHPKR